MKTLPDKKNQLQGINDFSFSQEDAIKAAKLIKHFNQSV